MTRLLCASISQLKNRTSDSSLTGFSGKGMEIIFIKFPAQHLTATQNKCLLLLSGFH
jgi:hypothetical protein